MIHSLLQLRHFTLRIIGCLVFLALGMALQPVTRPFPSASSSTTQRFYRPSVDLPSETSIPSIADIQAKLPRRQHLRLVSTLDDLARIIQQCRESNEIVMIFWSASWCRSCHRLQSQLQHLVQRNTERPIRFLHIPSAQQYSLSSKEQDTPQKNLHALFGIRTVPFCHIYYPTYGLVEERKLTPSSPTALRTKNAICLGQLEQILQSYQEGYCTLPEDDDDGVISPAPY